MSPADKSSAASAITPEWARQALPEDPGLASLPSQPTPQFVGDMDAVRRRLERLNVAPLNDIKREASLLQELGLYDEREQKLLTSLAQLRGKQLIDEVTKLEGSENVLRWTAEKLDDGEIDEDFWDKVVYPVWEAKRKAGPTGNISQDIVELGKAVPKVWDDFKKGLWGLATYGVTAISKGQIPEFDTAAELEKFERRTEGMNRQEKVQALAEFRRQKEEEELARQAPEVLRRAAEQGTAETYRYLLVRPGRTILNYLAGTLDETPEDRRKLANADLGFVRQLTRLERGEPEASFFDVLPALLGRDERTWMANRAKLLDAMGASQVERIQKMQQEAQKLEGEPLDKALREIEREVQLSERNRGMLENFVPTWQSYVEAEAAGRPKLTEEQRGYVAPIGEILDAGNIVPAGAGVKLATRPVTRVAAQAARKLAGKPVSPAVVAAEVIGATRAPAPSLRATVGTAVEEAGEMLERKAGSAAVRTVLAAGGAAATGAEPSTILLSALLANAPGSRRVSTAVPQMLKVAGKVIKYAPPGPISTLGSIAMGTARGAAGGTATMLLPAYLGGETSEERGTLLAGGTVVGGAVAAPVAVGNAALELGRSYWTNPPPQTGQRRQTATYGTAYDTPHAKVINNLSNNQANSVEGLRDILAQLTGGRSQLYVLDNADYNALQSRIPGVERSQGVYVASTGEVFIRVGGESLRHEVGHAIDHALETSFPAVRAELEDAVIRSYSPSELIEMRDAYEALMGKKISRPELIREVLAENFQAVLNGAPIDRLGTPQTLAQKVYVTMGLLGERLGLRSMGPGGQVATSETLRFTPSFEVVRAISNALSAATMSQTGQPVVPPAPAPTAAPTAPTAAPTPAPTPAPTAPTAAPTPAPTPAPTAPTALTAAPTPIPAPTAAPTPVPSPVAPAPAAPNIRGVTPERRAAFEGPSPELQAQNLSLLEAELTKAQGERVPLSGEYFSVLPGDKQPSELDQVTREKQREFADAAQREGFDNPLRALFEKTFIPVTSITTAAGKRNIFAFSYDKLIQNLDMLAGWARTTRNPTADAIRAMLDDPALPGDIRTYLDNQANGYAGDGTKLTRPPDTDPKRFPPENAAYTPVPLSAERRNFINLLMGLEGVAAGSMSPAAVFVRELARLNARTPSATPQQPGKAQKVEFNPLVDQLRQAGFDPILLNGVVEQLRVERIGSALQPQTGSPVRAGVQGTIQAGFMPSAPGQPIPPETSRGRFANPDVQDVAQQYLEDAGIVSEPHAREVPTNEDLLKRVADYYEGAPDRPSDPEVRAAYTSLADQVMAQYRAMLAAGVRIEPWTKEGQPYADSAEMMRDVRDNKRLYFFLTESGYGDMTPANQQNAMLAPAGVRIGGRDLVVNDIFRAVHDYFGHAMYGYEFGPRGEFNAFLEHSRMFTDDARPALAAETLAQNAWVNFGPHLRRPDGTLPKRGEEGYVPPAQRRFADQKNTVVPRSLLREVDQYAANFMPEQAEMAQPSADTRIVNISLKMPVEEALEVMRRNGVEPLGYEVDETSGVQIMVAEVPAAPAETFEALASELEQDTIAVYDAARGEGEIYGPGAETLQEGSEVGFVEMPEREMPQIEVEDSLAFMPVHFRGNKLPHAVRDKVLKLTHYSAIEGLNVIDPTFMTTGIGAQGKKLLMGDPRSFWLVGRGQLKSGDGARGKTVRYTAEVSGAKMYDMDKDVLELWDRTQPTIDKTLKEAGYVGFVAKTKDGRRFAAIYEAIPFNRKGRIEAEKRQRKLDREQRELLADIPPDTEEVSEEVLKDRAWSRVLEESDRTGEPLDVVARRIGRREGIDFGFMPATNKPRLTHRRRTNKLSSGYVAQFAEENQFGDGPNSNYGPHKWTLVDELPPVPDYIVDFAAEYYAVSREEAESLVKPKDIVNNAGAWDDEQFVSDVWQRFEPNGFRTPDGAVVLNKEDVKLEYSYDDPNDPNILYMPPKDKSKLHVDRAAIRWNGRVITGEPESFHQQLIDNLVEDLAARNSPATVDEDAVERGFVDSDGKYLTRQQAFDLARASGQVARGSRTMAQEERFGGKQLEAIAFAKDRGLQPQLDYMPARLTDVWNALRRAGTPAKDEVVSVSQDFETLGDGQSVLLARAGDKIVGYVAVDKNYGGSDTEQRPMNNRWGWLDIEVAKGWRRRGIGTALYSRAQDIAKAAKARYVMSSKTSDGRKFFPQAEARYEEQLEGTADFMPEGTFVLDEAAADRFMPMPRTDLEDHIGKTVIVLPIDRLGAGEVEVGPEGRRRTLEAQGGRGYPLLYPGEGWAFANEGTANRFLTRLRAAAGDQKSVLVVTSILNENNHLKSRFGQIATASAYEAAIDAGLFSRRAVDRTFKEVFQRAANSAGELSAPDLQTLKSIKSLEAFREAAQQGKLTFAAMAEIVPRLDAKRLPIPFEERVAAGVDTGTLSRDLSDPELVGLPTFSLVSLMEIPVEQKASHDKRHVSYPWGIKGELLGFFRTPYNPDTLIEDPRIRTRTGNRITAQPLQTVLPVLSGAQISQTNPEPRARLRSARIPGNVQTP